MMTVQLLALTQAGKVVVLPCQELARVAGTAQKMVEHGEWRTWDAFETPDDESKPRRLVASHQPDTKPGRLDPHYRATHERQDRERCDDLQGKCCPP